MAVSRADKQLELGQLTESFGKSESLILLEYKGLKDAVRRLLAARSHVEQVAHAHNLPDAQVGYVLHQKLHQELDGGAFPLQ